MVFSFFAQPLTPTPADEWIADAFAPDEVAESWASFPSYVSPYLSPRHTTEKEAHGQQGKMMDAPREEDTTPNSEGRDDAATSSCRSLHAATSDVMELTNDSSRDGARVDDDDDGDAAEALCDLAPSESTILSNVELTMILDAKESLIDDYDGSTVVTNHPEKPMDCISPRYYAINQSDSLTYDSNLDWTLQDPLSGKLCLGEIDVSSTMKVDENKEATTPLEDPVSAHLDDFHAPPSLEQAAGIMTVSSVMASVGGVVEKEGTTKKKSTGLKSHRVSSSRKSAVEKLLDRVRSKSKTKKENTVSSSFNLEDESNSIKTEGSERIKTAKTNKTKMRSSVASKEMKTRVNKKLFVSETRSVACPNNSREKTSKMNVGRGARFSFGGKSRKGAVHEKLLSVPPPAYSSSVADTSNTVDRGTSPFLLYPIASSEQSTANPPAPDSGDCIDQQCIMNTKEFFANACSVGGAANHRSSLQAVDDCSMTNEVASIISDVSKAGKVAITELVDNFNKMVASAMPEDEPLTAEEGPSLAGDVKGGDTMERNVEGSEVRKHKNVLHEESPSPAMVDAIASPSTIDVSMRETSDVIGSSLTPLEHIETKIDIASDIRPVVETSSNKLITTATAAAVVVKEMNVGSSAADLNEGEKEMPNPNSTTNCQGAWAEDKSRENSATCPPSIEDNVDEYGIIRTETEQSSIKTEEVVKAISETNKQQSQQEQGWCVVASLVENLNNMMTPGMPATESTNQSPQWVLSDYLEDTTQMNDTDGYNEERCMFALTHDDKVDKQTDSMASNTNNTKEMTEILESSLLDDEEIEMNGQSMPDELPEAVSVESSIELSLIEEAMDARLGKVKTSMKKKKMFKFKLFEQQKAREESEATIEYHELKTIIPVGELADDEEIFEQVKVRKESDATIEYHELKTINPVGELVNGVEMNTGDTHSSRPSLFSLLMYTDLPPMKRAEPNQKVKSPKSHNEFPRERSLPPDPISDISKVADSFNEKNESIGASLEGTTPKVFKRAHARWRKKRDKTPNNGSTEIALTFDKPFGKGGKKANSMDTKELNTDDSKELTEVQLEETRQGDSCENNIELSYAQPFGKWEEKLDPKELPKTNELKESESSEPTLSDYEVTKEVDSCESSIELLLQGLEEKGTTLNVSSDDKAVTFNTPVGEGRANDNSTETEELNNDSKELTEVEQYELTEQVDSCESKIELSLIEMALDTTPETRLKETARRPIVSRWGKMKMNNKQFKVDGVRVPRDESETKGMKIFHPVKKVSTKKERERKLTDQAPKELAMANANEALTMTKSSDRPLCGDEAAKLHRQSTEVCFVSVSPRHRLAGPKLNSDAILRESIRRLKNESTGLTLDLPLNGDAETNEEMFLSAELPILDTSESSALPPSPILSKKRFKTKSASTESSKISPSRAHRHPTVSTRRQRKDTSLGKRKKNKKVKTNKYEPPEEAYPYSSCSSDYSLSFGSSDTFDDDDIWCSFGCLDIHTETGEQDLTAVNSHEGKCISPKMLM